MKVIITSTINSVTTTDMFTVDTDIHFTVSDLPIAHCSNYDMDDELFNHMVIEACEVPEESDDSTVQVECVVNGTSQGQKALPVGATVGEVAAILGVNAGSVRIRLAGANTETVPNSANVLVISSPEKYQGA